MFLTSSWSNLIPWLRMFFCLLSQRKNTLEEWINIYPHRFCVPPIFTHPPPIYADHPPEFTPAPNPPTPCSSSGVGDAVCVCLLVCGGDGGGRAITAQVTELVTGVRCYGVSHFLHEDLPSTIHKTAPWVPGNTSHEVTDTPYMSPFDPVKASKKFSSTERKIKML